MRLPMVDCRSLIEFCRAFEQHKNTLPHTIKHDNKNKNNNNNNNSDNGLTVNNNNNKKSSVNPLSHPFCDKSPFAALDVLILILVVGALGYLTIPYINIIYNIYNEFVRVLPLVNETLYIVSEVIAEAPIAYVIGAVAAFTGVIVTIVVWEIVEVKSRKCGKSECRGLRKAVEFDIQLESEECVKYLMSGGKSGYGDVMPLELGQDHKELEVELKKMAPVNGRTVLIFRAPCGCPAGRLEVWGAKRVRRIKK